jgi:hypothetical protein
MNAPSSHPQLSALWMSPSRKAASQKEEAILSLNGQQEQPSNKETPAATATDIFTNPLQHHFG